jgi:hypothetical protein
MPSIDGSSTVMQMCWKIANMWVKYIDPIALMNRPSDMEIELCWYQVINVDLCFDQPHHSRSNW